MSDFFDSIVYRIYKCYECEGEIGVEQTLKDDWLKECPFCSKEALLIKEGNLASQAMVDVKKPKTLGSLSEKNRDKKIKEGEDTTGMRKKPFWRDSHKINFDILKNPTKYVFGKN